MRRVIDVPPAHVGPDAPRRAVEQLVDRLRSPRQQVDRKKGSPVSLVMPFDPVREDDLVVLTAAPGEVAG